MTLPRRLVSLLLIYCFAIAVAPHPRVAVSSSSPFLRPEADSSTTEKVYDFFSSLFSSNGASSSDDENADKEEGLRFRLSEAAEQPEARPVTNAVPATPLSDSETEAILKRLPPIKTEASDETEFALREKSLPPPRTGTTVMQPFPAPNQMATPEQTTTGPLEVVRYSPEGDVPIAPDLSVTFSQPMVAVTSQEEAAEYVPVKLSPQPTGKWRWIGTKTLLFEPDARFPMATQYSVTLPTGTKSANGGTLAAAKTWTFATPPPTVKTFYPTRASVQRRDVLMFAEFDQRIDPAAILRGVRVEGGKTQISIRLATREEIEKDNEIRQMAKHAVKDRWLAFRAIDSSGNPQNALPAGTNINVSVLAGTPSAEGPRTTTQTQSFPFMTFGPLRVTKHECGYNRSCTPSDIWSVEFSNPLDVSAFQDSQIKVEPHVEGLKTSIYNNTLYISGTKPGRTTYRVTLDPSITDKFGQTLGASATVSFAVGAAPPAIFSGGGSFIVLDPAGPASAPVYTINYDNVRVRLYSVVPEDWPAWVYYQRNEQGYNDDPARKQTTPPGRLLYSRIVAVSAKPEEMVETDIDLSAALKDGFGEMILIVEPEPPPARKNRFQRDSVQAWIQRTNIGLDAFVDRTDLIGWATSLKDGAALGNVAITLMPGGIAARSGADGMARIALPSQSPNLPPNLIVARAGSDVAILPEQTQYWNGLGSWFRKDTSDALRWYVFDDRGLYRPGEEVRVKGWIRRVGSAKDGDVGTLNKAAASVSYVLKDSRGNEVTKGNLAINALGGFDFALKLPPTMNLGWANIALKAEGGIGAATGRDFGHNFRVEEFRRPEFEVSVKTQTEGPLLVGDHADASVTANYFAGGGLANAEVTWRVTSTPGTFTPPNRGDFTFGKWIPWWGINSQRNDSHTETLTARTDASGKHRLRIDFDSVNPARPSTVTAQATVMDVNRQAWTSTARMLVHPANLYVGLKSERTFVQQGEPLVVQSIVTDLDGNAIANREVKMRAVLLDWKQVKGEWKQVESSPQDCAVQSAVDAVKCTFTRKEGGTYRVTATIHDDRGRANESELTLWVAGGKRPPVRNVTQEKVELIPDRKEYQAGDAAQILVQAPFYPAEAVMSLQRSGIVKTERFRIDGPTYTLRVPIEEAWTPNVHVQVDIVGFEPRDISSLKSQVSTQGRREKLGTLDLRPETMSRPAYASGEINLSIPPLSRKLSVVATPSEKTLEPGGNSVISIDAKDASGKPVSNSEVAVVVVDESVLALTNYKLTDPIATFYAQRSGDTANYHSRSNVVLATLPGERGGITRGGGGGGTAGSGEGISYNRIAASDTLTRQPYKYERLQVLAELARPAATPTQGPGEAEQIRLRENFNALAVFAPSVRTDANGHAQVQVKLPDNLTRYRVMAVAVADGKQFGSGESAITARLPLMARPSAPRFLNFGDRFELPIVLQNQTDAPMTVDVAVRATNASFTGTAAVSSASARQSLSALSDGTAARRSVAGRRVVVPANDRVELRIPAAAVKAGTARFQIGAVSGRWSDAAEVELPVWTPATTEAFATYGEIDDGAINQPVKAPANVFPQFGGLEIETSSTQLQELTDAVIYLTSYPYECSEQLASRIITIAALRDVLTAFKAKDLPSPKEMEAAVTRDLKRLQGMQNSDGGFGFWQRGDESWPYLSIHVAHALARAKQKKFDVPKEMFDKSQKYLREIDSHIPSYYGVDARRAIIAYALYVRAQMGDRDAARARKLIAEAGLEKLSLESVGWLLSVLSGDSGSLSEVAAIRHLLNNRVTETAGMAHFVCSYSDSDYLLLNSDRRADGVILEALIGDQPNSDLIPKIVRGLLAHRTRGRWENTQENVFILLALDRYFNTFEKVTPNFVARAWLGEHFAGEQQFRGRSTERQQVQVPMRYLAQQSGAQNLIISKDGAGRLYYRVGMNYAPSDLNLKPVDYGFTVERSYEAVDDPKDVSRATDGTWLIKAGARVRVRLTMVATARRYHVALVDPLPAGFEALNPSFATTESIPRDEKQTSVGVFGSLASINGGYGSWWWRPEWFEHQNLRDERAEAFTSLLWEGVYKYSYVARATTPGNFVVPPAKAEEMYHPETFGRSKSDHVRIE
jgi:uncharacterized protein YfaS (alpha-2-macroglobulin family)